ncbi:MAG: S8 family serine peptidase [Candidatus Saganbacteria bacterium]|nr:S8 family serine peptidase [Candidatus Saganbacteria bacterium]
MSENNIIIAFIDQIGGWFGTPAAGAKQGAGTEVKQPEPRFSPDTVIVKFRSVSVANSETPVTDHRTINQLFSRHGVSALRRVFPGEGKQLGRDPRRPRGPLPDLTHIYELKIKPGQDIARIVEEYRRDPNVEYAEPDYLCYPAAAAPNDPYFPSQWNLAAIQAPQAWEIQKGDANRIIAVVDTGIDYNRPDIAANILANTDETETNGKDNDGNGYPNDFRGWNFVDNNNDPMDQDGHGTVVAGITGAVPNNGIGISGINWQSKIMALKGGDSSGFYDSNTSAAIRYAADNGAEVINMSWGRYGFLSQTLAEAILYAYNKGVILVGAAGNNGTREPLYPAALSPWVIAVGATSETGRMYNLGTWLDIAAPGVNIMSLRANNATDCVPYYGDPDYCSKSGTSMAAPHVAGAISLLLSQNPALTSSQVRNIIRASADDLGPAGFDPYYGAGQLDIYKALTRASIATPDVNAGITSPKPYEYFGLGQENNDPNKLATPIEISGYADGFASGSGSFLLSIAAGENPVSFSTTGFTLVGGGTSPVSGGKLGSFDPSTLTKAGIYTVKLSVTGTKGTNESLFSFIFDPDLAVGWPKTVGNQQSGGVGIPFVSEKSVPTFADLKGDGRENIYVNSRDCNFYGWDLSGAALSGWPKPNNCSDAAPAAGDLNGDGHKEIVLASGGTVSAWRYDGAFLTGFPLSLAQADGTPSLGDINGDGKLEIMGVTKLGSNSYSSLFALKNDGTILFNVPITPGDNDPSPVTLCDLNGDQKPEMIFGVASNIYAYGVDAAGVISCFWTTALSDGIGSSNPATCADINQDGFPEIIMGTGDSYRIVLDHNGGFFLGPTSFNNVPSAGIPLSLNGDNNLDMIFTDDYVKVIDRRNAYVPPYPITAADRRPWSGGIVGGNLSGSGFPEFLVPSVLDEGGYYINGYGLLRLYNKTGEITNARFPKTTLGQQPGLSPAIGSPAGPGSSYLAVSANFYTGTKVLVYNNRVAYSAQANPWPQFQHDLARTGNYNTDVVPPSVSCTPIAQAPANSQIAVSCLISDTNGILGAQIYYRNASAASYQNTPMNVVADNSWQGTIPATVGTNQVNWYVVAHDKAINPAIYPAGAPDTVNNISLVDKVSPKVTVTPVTTAYLAQPLVINNVVATDNIGLQAVYLHYRTKGADAWQSRPMEGVGSDYSAIIPSKELNLAGLEYYIEAVDPSGNATGSSVFSVTVIDDLPPSWPVNLTAVASGSQQVTLFWLPPTTNADGSLLTDLAGYNVTYRDLTAGSDWLAVPINAGNVTERIVTGLAADHTYEFKVQAYDNKQPANISDWSNGATATLIIHPLVDSGVPETESPVVPVDAESELPATTPDAGMDATSLEASPEAPAAIIPDADLPEVKPVEPQTPPQRSRGGCGCALGGVY